MNGLCLSGGGIKAAAHIGAIRALEEANIRFDYVSGTSSGSIIATLYALGYKSNEMYEFFKKYSNKIKYIQFKLILKIIYGLVFKGKIIVKGLNDGEILSKIVRKFASQKGIKNINQIKMPIAIPMTRLSDGKLYVATSKQVRNTYSDKITYVSDMDIAKVVEASCSYPLVFCPCEINNKQFVDGGVRENTPWKELKALGAEKVLGIGFETILENTEKFDNMIEIGIQSMNLICHELSNYEIDGIDYLIEVPTKKVSLLDMTKIDELYEAGYEITKKKLKTFDLS